MSFDTPFFLCVFLPILAVLYALIPKARKWLMLAAGLLFSAFGSLSGMVILLVSAGANYALSKLPCSNRRIPLAVGIAGNLLLLGYFKYLRFFLEQILQVSAPMDTIAVPLGISFFTFKCISYLWDAASDPSGQANSFADFLLYVSFFPQLTAGPITRFHSFRLDAPVPEKMAMGFRRFIWGLCKKLLIAYPLSKIADPVFTAAGLSAAAAWVGALSYTLQIYFDFSAYSDMAIGLGRMFGAETPENFLFPYTAFSITDFWRRWHISLSEWFRDYLYIPLGGNRKGKVRAACNKIIVFVLCGFWHGAGWTFLMWGLWHGVLAALETLKVIRPRKDGMCGVLSYVYTLLAVCIGFVLFRAASLSDAGRVLCAMAGIGTGHFNIQTILTMRGAAAMLAGILFSLPVEQWFSKKENALPVLTPVSWGVSLVLLMICLCAIAANGFQPFIYAQF